MKEMLAVAALVMLAGLPSTAQAGALPHDCLARLAAGERGRVAEVIDGETLRLDSGLTVRLIGALAPRDGGPAERTAVAFVEARVRGRHVRLAYGGARRDRHDRALAQVLVEEGQGKGAVWLQGAAVEAGHARAYSLPDNRACAGALLAREARARERAEGLWSDSALAVRSAHEPEMLATGGGQFAIVEGRVASVRRWRKRLFVNFSHRWRDDFTAGIAARDRRRFDEAAVERLAGRRVRLRGWLEAWRGPYMALTHPEQIEVID